MLNLKLVLEKKLGNIEAEEVFLLMLKMGVFKVTAFLSLQIYNFMISKIIKQTTIIHFTDENPKNKGKLHIFFQIILNYILLIY